MKRISEIYKYKTTPKCKEKAVVKGDKYRFTILTPSLIRMEYNENGAFEDRATQIVTNRDFEVPEYKVIQRGETLIIRTTRLEVIYHRNYPFNESSLTARFYGEWGDNTTTWRFKNTAPTYGNSPRTYEGTVRSLDIMSGPIPLGNSLMSEHFGELDDSKSMIIADDGWVDERPDNIEDTYLFAYREHHIECLHDFLELSGKIPMLPRYALGNWWCRYHAYTDTEYMQLMERFEKEDIPFSVAMLDMDWHITDVDKKDGTGWTGYTWNKNLFPNPKAFAEKIHNKNLKIGVNLHDREGIASHEEHYLEIAKAVGVDYENKEKVNFDFGNPVFVENYFKYTHHNNEDTVDFWWVDGFPENTSELNKADTAWMLNHYHCVDAMKNGNRPMLLSRRSGMGGHRYGIGFSGDAYATWEMLDFQPYFTSTSANVGFGWWSHDIGGFEKGEHDDELMTRWVQFGVFSPICRLHSTNNPYMSKEPWNYNESAEKIIKEYLRLRHRLLPYIYTMNYNCYKNNITLIRPLYYYCKHFNKNEYFFGNDFLVNPITTKIDEVTHMGNADIYLPDGLWFDFFSSRAYIGDRNYKVYRKLSEMPVFVKAGAIIPQSNADGWNETSNPKAFRVDVFGGDNGEFDLYEDDGISLEYENGKCVITKMKFNWSETPSLVIEKPDGATNLIPGGRDYEIVFRKISDCNEISIMHNGQAIEFEKEYKNNSVIVKVKSISGKLEVCLKGGVKLLGNDYKNEADALIRDVKISHTQKWDLGKMLAEENCIPKILLEVSRNEYDKNFADAMKEILLADMQ